MADNTGLTIDPLLSGRDSSIRRAHLTFDLDLCRAKKHKVVNGSRAVGGSSCGWKEQSGQR